jgi:condensin complex subunit 3
MAPHQTTLDTLQENLASVFEQTQLTIANHRKNCVALFKIHHEASTVTQVVNRGAAVKLIGERSFGDAFVDMVNRILVVKKGATSVDRTVRFIGEYVKFMNEKGAFNGFFLCFFLRVI